MPRLTILLPLKGRHLHTLRFLWHANRQNMPFRFLIADGQVDPIMARLLEEPADAFPNLDIEYVRYPDDISYSVLYRKMASAAARVQTPYVMQADNDDFPVRSGIDRCTDFLDANSDYASCGGGIRGFSLQPGAGRMTTVVGEIQSLGADYHGTDLDQDYASPLASERIRQRFAAGYTLYYNVYRTAALTAILQECAAMDFSDLQVHETYFGARAKSLGKIRIDRSVMSYMWQYGTSMSAASIDKMWADRIREGWSADSIGPQLDAEITTFADAIARAIAKTDGIDANRFAAEIRRLCLDKFQQYLNTRIGRLQSQKAGARWRDAVKRLLVGLAPEAIIRLRRRRLLRKGREAMFDALRQFGAPDNYISTFRGELAAIESTLEGAAFGEFVRRHAPGLIA